MESLILQRLEEQRQEGLQDMISGNVMVNGEFLNRKQRQMALRQGESALTVYTNHNSETARAKLRAKLLDRKMKKLT